MITFINTVLLNLWWASKSVLEQIFWAIAVIATIAFVVQSLFSLSGGDNHDGDLASDTDTVDGSTHDGGIPYQFFTIKNLLAFFTMFGWTGLGVYSSSGSSGASLIAALIAGALTMFFMAWLFKQMNSLQYNGTTNLKNAIGNSAKVYLYIPAKKEGQGKVHIVIQSALKEIDAVTNDEEIIKTGDTVKIVDLLSNDTFLVTKMN